MEPFFREEVCAPLPLCSQEPGKGVMKPYTPETFNPKPQTLEEIREPYSPRVPPA